jgi:hypothetical protein
VKAKAKKTSTSLILFSLNSNDSHNPATIGATLNFEAIANPLDKAEAHL